LHELRVLLVEDDELLGSAVQTGLEQFGYTVDWLTNGRQAADALQTDQPDLLILDLGLPGKDGLTLLSDLRMRDCSIPVLILTARDTVEDRILGLDMGADDYLVKPFDLGELNARLRAIFRRQSGRATPLIRYRDMVFNPAAHIININGIEVQLHAKANAILEALLQRPGIPLSRERLEQILYGWGDGVESNTVEVHIHHLRKKLGKETILTIRGVGYMVPKP